MVPNVSRWIQMVTNGYKWFQMVPNGSKGFKCSKRFQMVPNEHHDTHLRPCLRVSWITLVHPNRILLLIRSCLLMEVLYSTQIIILKNWRENNFENLLPTVCNSGSNFVGSLPTKCHLGSRGGGTNWPYLGFACFLSI